MAARTQTGSARGIAHGLAQRLTFLPEPVREFLHRRTFEIFGLSLVTIAGALILALFSYNSLDLSFNNATGLGTDNLLGPTGATVADLCLQTFGITAMLPVFAFLAWGTRLVCHHPIRRVGWRILCLLLAMCLAAFALEYAPVPAGWPLRAGLGGTFGMLTFVPTSSWLSTLGLTPAVLAFTLAPVAALLMFVALGLSRTEWRNMGQGIASGIRWVARHGADISQSGTARIHRLIPQRGMVREEPRLKPTDDAQPVTRGADAGDTPPVPRRVAPRAQKPKPSKRAEESRQRKLDLPTPGGKYEFPPLDLLEEADEPARAAGRTHDENLEANARLLESVLQDFGVHGKIVQVRPGPVVTLYELEPAPGTKTSRVIGLADDIARSMSAVSVRIAVVPGQNVIGIELPNASREIVYIRELLASRSFEKSGADLALALGKDIGGEPVTVDLARMPHLLIAGTTGSGKSVGVNSMIASLLYRLTPEQCRFIMIDPKMLELSVYDGIPHLLSPVVTDPKKAVVALKWVTREMEDRYRAMSKLGVRNVAGYNQRIEEARKKGETLSRKVQTGFDEETGKPVFEEQPLDMVALPYIVVVVDEMADLMLVAGKDVEAAIQRLAQMARAAGIHLILATQRPSVDVITGTIKANLPTRISFQVTTKIDSRTILGEQGAEQLLGQGDMLYMAGGGRITRVHGPFLADTEVEDLVAFLKAQGEPEYLDEVTEDEGAADGIPGFESTGESSGDELYDQAIALVAR
ncbi:MAG: DNA translocase FtsK 4TM domain-containing protein, partial [Alphaproteobacteria bacterium]|nr:DNA translocase FtsK 4TM domain-containing protein [Alphaproteobacteria bacterium]